MSKWRIEDFDPDTFKVSLNDEEVIISLAMLIVSSPRLG